MSVKRTILGLLVTAALSHGIIRVPLERVFVPVQEVEDASVINSSSSVMLGEAALFGYVGMIELGTPPQKFRLLMDTGSWDLWVISAEVCREDPGYCRQYNTFDPSESSTFMPENGIASLAYDAGVVAGPVGRDVLNIYGYRIPNVPFAMVNYGTGSTLQNAPMDGILGLSFQAAANIYSGFPPRSNLIQTQIYSFRFTRDGTPGSEMILGGSDPSLYRGEVNYVPMNSDRFLQVEMNSLNVNGIELCAGGCSAVPDTGTPGLAAPVQFMQHLWELIPAYSIPCSEIDRLPTIYFSFSGRKFSLESEYYMQQEEGNPGYCIRCSFYGSSFANNPFILGEVFLRKYYTEFDMYNMRIGFAPAV